MIPVSMLRKSRFALDCCVDDREDRRSNRAWRLRRKLPCLTSSGEWRAACFVSWNCRMDRGTEGWREGPLVPSLHDLPFPPQVKKMPRRASSRLAMRWMSPEGTLGSSSVEDPALSSRFTSFATSGKAVPRQEKMASLAPTPFPAVLGGEPVVFATPLQTIKVLLSPDFGSALPDNSGVLNQERLAQRPDGWQQRHVKPIARTNRGRSRAPPGGSAGSGGGLLLLRSPGLGASTPHSAPLPPCLSSPLPLRQCAAEGTCAAGGAVGVVLMTPKTRSRSLGSAMPGAAAGSAHPPPLRRRPFRKSRSANRLAAGTPAPSSEAPHSALRPVHLFRLDPDVLLGCPAGAHGGGPCAAGWAATLSSPLKSSRRGVAGGSLPSHLRVARQQHHSPSAGGFGCSVAGEGGALSPRVLVGQGSVAIHDDASDLGDDSCDASVAWDSAGLPALPVLELLGRDSENRGGGSSVYSGMCDGSIASGTLAVSAAGTGAGAAVAAAAVAASLAAAGSAAEAAGGARVLPAHERPVMLRLYRSGTGSSPAGKAAGADALRAGVTLELQVLLMRARSHCSPASGPCLHASAPPVAAQRSHSVAFSDEAGAAYFTTPPPAAAPLLSSPLLGPASAVSEDHCLSGVASRASAPAPFSAFVAQPETSVVLGTGTGGAPPSAPDAEDSMGLGAVAAVRASAAPSGMDDSPLWNDAAAAPHSSSHLLLPQIRSGGGAGDLCPSSGRSGHFDSDAPVGCAVRKRLPFDDPVEPRDAPCLTAAMALPLPVVAPPVSWAAPWLSEAARSCVADSLDPGLARGAMLPPPQRSPQLARKRSRRVAARSPPLVHSVIGGQQPAASPAPAATAASFASGSPSAGSVFAAATPPPRYPGKRLTCGSLSSGPWSSSSRSGSRVYSEALAEQSLGASHRGSVRSRVAGSCADDSEFALFLGCDVASLASVPAGSPACSSEFSDALLSPSFGGPAESPAPSAASFDVLEAPPTGGGCYRGWMPAASPVSMADGDDEAAPDEDVDGEAQGFSSCDRAS